MSLLFKRSLVRLKREKAARAQELKDLKRDTAAGFQELKKDFEVFKPTFQFLGVAVPMAITVVRMWSDYPGMAISLLIVLAAFSVVWFVLACDVPVISAFRSARNDVRTNTTRDFLLISSASASVFLFIFAVVDAKSPAPSFFAGALGLVALLVAKARFAARNVPVSRWSSFVDSLIEPLLIFTAIAAIFALATALLDYAVDSGSIILRQLESLDRSALRARMFFDRLHFSAVTAVELAALFVLFRWLERKWTRHIVAAHGKAGIFRLAMKGAARLAIAVLFIAWFSFLAAKQRESLLAAGLREFNNKYFRFQDKVDQRIEPVFKRDLITNAWTRLDEHGRMAIRESVLNRKAFQTLEYGYQALAELGFHDQRTKRTISEMRPPDFAKENSTGTARVTQEPVLPAAALQQVSLGAVRRANVVEYVPKERPVPEPSEEVQEMDSAVRTGLRDIVTDTVIHQNLYHWLDIHFPGLDDILDSIKGADRESVTNLQEARDRVIRRTLALPRSVLDDLVAEEARAGATRVPLHPPHVFERYRNISAERETIHRVEVLLHHQAPKVIESALQSSKARTQHMATQLHKLDGLHPSLRLFSNKSEYLSESEYRRRASQITLSQEARPHNLERIKPFADSGSIDQLSQQLSTEQYYENLLAALVGIGTYEVPEAKTVLGPEFDKYKKIYDEWLTRWISNLSYGDD